jgi:hypothetical protein
LSSGYRTGSGRALRLGKKLAEGAAGAAFVLDGDPGVIFKLLSEPSDEDERRIKAMLQVSVPIRVPGASAVIAWPNDLVFDGGGRYVGFLMPSAPGPAPVNLAQLALRREREKNVGPNLGWDALLAVCASYSAAIAALHAFPIVLCDINLKNVVVSGDLTVTVIDCDSIQIEVASQFYGSRFCQDEFLAPELKEIADLAGHRRDQSSDRWALAVLIWMTLMDGHHPFAGVWSGRGEPDRDEHAAVGRFPYARGSAPLAPSPEAPPWRAMPRNLRKLFLTTFTDGAQRPERRPSALEWGSALEEAKGKLKECDGALGRRHRFPQTEKSCPWCEYERYLGSTRTPRTSSPRQPSRTSGSTKATSPTRPLWPTPAKATPPTGTPASRIRGLPSAAVRGGWVILRGGVACLILSMVLAIAVTFDVGASFEAELAAAWHFIWLPLLVGTGCAWSGSIVHDALQSSRGHRFWPETVRLTHFGVVCVAVGGAFIGGAASEGAIPPSAWSGFPLAICVAFLVTLSASFLITRIANRVPALLAALLICSLAAGVAWAAAPRSDLPSQSDQRTLDHRLAQAVSLRQCHSRSIEKLPPGTLRNSLDGLIFCHNRRIRGKFLAFSNDDLLGLYGSQQERKVEGRSEDPAKWCNNRSGAYTDTWFKQAHPSHAIGRLLCYGRRGKAVLKWEDPRDDLFGIIRGPGRRRNYHWWHVHQVGIKWR